MNPYRHRIMLTAPGQAPIELVRFRRTICNLDRKTWLRDLSPTWTVIEERTTPPGCHKNNRK